MSASHRRPLPAVMLLATLATLLFATTTHQAWAAGSPPDTRPNFILLLTDDLDIESPDHAWLDHYPKLKAFMADAGTTFRNAFVSLSVCCPSRTTILRGQYAHNTGIYRIVPPDGGFEDVYAKGLEQSTVATWLHRAGYRTALLGKYLNGYPSTDVGPNYVPPGWDEWYAGQEGAYNQFNYDLNENGKINHYGNQPGDYLQDVLRDRALDFLARNADSGTRRPFFMYFATYSPHTPARPAPRHAKLFSDLSAPRPPTFNEADLSDKPYWLRGYPRLTTAEITQIDQLYRNRLRSMVAVVETLEALIEALARSGELANTYIVFTSDNGFHMGQHRLPPGKFTAIEEDVRVPLIVRGPGVAQGAVRNELTINADFAPTFADLAGIAAPAFVDGRSLRPLLHAVPLADVPWRDAVLLERGREPDVVVAPGHTIVPADQTQKRRNPASLRGIRTARYAYIEYLSTGERELYDVESDPFQRHNVAANASAELLQRLSARLTAFRSCAGESCRTADAR